MSTIYDEFYAVKTERGLVELISNLERSLRIMDAMKHYALIRAEKLRIGDGGSVLAPEAFLKMNIRKLNIKLEEQVSSDE